jgi:alpha-1,6-mannosyltransferase
VTRVLVRFVLGGIGVLSLAGYALDTGPLLGDETNVFTRHVTVFSALFALYLSATWLTLRRGGHDRVVLGLVLGFGLLFRVAVLPTPVVLSSDVNRYLWDGRVQRAGISPYRYPPAAPELAHLRDEAIYPNINRPTKPTIYPPGAQVLFAAVTTVFPDRLLGWRLFLLGCELATVVLLLRLLHRMGRPAGAVILYAWAPLAVFEGVQAGHLEPALLPLVLLALLWRQEGRMAMAGAAMGSAVLLKLYPAALALAWWRRGDRRFPVTCVGVLAAGYLAYAAPVGFEVLGFLPQYFSSAEDFNIGLRWFLTEGIGLGGHGVASEVSRGLVMLLLFGLLGHVLLWIRRGLREGADGIFAAGFAAVGAWLLLTPTALHAWYVMWILPFLAVAPSAAWLWLTGAVALSYLKYAWSELPLWARLVEFVPVYALLIWQWRRRARSGAAAASMADPHLPAAPASSRGSA